MTPIENDAKRLTLFLGKKWHMITTNLNPDSDGWMWSTCVCGDKWSDHSIDSLHRNRTFFHPDDWADLGAVRNRLIETNKFYNFYWWAEFKWLEDNKELFNDADFNEYFFYPPTFNRLVSEFLEQE